MTWLLFAFGLLIWLLCRNSVKPLRWPDELLPLSAIVAAYVSEFPGRIMGLAVLCIGVLAALAGIGTWPAWVGLAAASLGLSNLIGHFAARKSAEQILAKELDAIGGPINGSSTYKLHTDIAYGSHPKQKLDMYEPHEPHNGGLRPGFMYIHGGGWTIGSKSVQGKMICRALAEQRWGVMSINYRLSPKAKYPEHLHDAKRAIAWYRDNAREWGCDPDFLMVGGGSAGAQLAAMCSLTSDDLTLQPGFEQASTHVQGCVMFCGVFELADLLEGSHHRAMSKLLRFVFEESGSQEEVLRQASPMHQARPDAPPFLVVHGESDNLIPVESARRFVHKMRNISAEPVVYCELPQAHHGFDVFASRRARLAARSAAAFCQGVYAQSGKMAHQSLHSEN